MRIALAGFIFLAGCGYSARNVELIGQVKKVGQMTPLICPDRYDVDISLGVMRDGTGSMSSQDMWLTVKDPATLAVLKSANETGAIVKINYDVHRLTFCQKNYEATMAELSK